MSFDPFKQMIQAREAKEQSPHRIHKVGALLHLQNDTQNGTKIQGYNDWPETLLNTIGRDTKLGNASTSLHAETAALIKAKTTTNKANIYITDLPCPNCAKIVAEAGISNVYIDAHTHNTPLGQKMRPFFEQVSMLIFERAGIGVHEIKLEKQSIRELLPPATLRREQQESPLDKSHPFATCFAHDHKGERHNLSAHTQNAPGLTPKDVKHICKVQQKYEPALQPFNRLLAQCSRKALCMENGSLFTSQCPTAREFVNMIGYGITRITIGSPEICRDQHGLAALKQLREHTVMEISS